MLFERLGERFQRAELSAAEPSGTYAGFFAMSELEAVCGKLALPQELIREFRVGRAAKYESYEGFSLMELNLLDKQKLCLLPQRIFIYHSASRFLLFSDLTDCVERLSDGFEQAERQWVFGEQIYHVLKQLFQGDLLMLEHMESNIAALEDGLMAETREDCVKKIIEIRRKLMLVKNHYEQILDLTEDLMENENGLFDEPTLQLIRILSDRIDRLNQHVLSLREYITQVREAYQAQVDINLNQTMKIFTVITTIFLPLTLIAGWYGMNLAMPETRWPHSYLMVIVLSVAVVVVCIWFFKKKKWF